IFNLTFSGTANQIVDLAMTGSTYNSCWSYTIFNTDGTRLAAPSCGYPASSTGSLTLSSPGTYSVLIDPGSAVGGVTATLTQRMTQSLAFNTPLTVSSTLVGQIFALSFSGMVNQIVDLTMTGSTYNTCWNYKIFNPDGTRLA